MLIEAILPPRDRSTRTHEGGFPSRRVSVEKRHFPQVALFPFSGAVSFPGFRSAPVSPRQRLP
jgi:hypothetical protein